MLNHLLHEPRVKEMPVVRDFCHSNNIFSVRLDRYVGGTIRLIVPDLVTIPDCTFGDLLLRCVPLHLGDPNGFPSLRSGSQLEVLPEITIRSGLPIGPVLLALAQLHEDPPGPVKECLTIRADVDRAVRTESHDGRSQLGASGTPSKAPNGSVQHKT